MKGGRSSAGWTRKTSTILLVKEKQTHHYFPARAPSFISISHSPSFRQTLLFSRRYITPAVFNLASHYERAQCNDHPGRGPAPAESSSMWGYPHSPHKSRHFHCSTWLMVLSTAHRTLAYKTYLILNSPVSCRVEI